MNETIIAITRTVPEPTRPVRPVAAVLIGSREPNAAGAGIKAAGAQ
ncbi:MULTISPECIES: hypothetical protein [Streptomyces]|nr:MULTISPECIES: hypothetical protein [Streptomyces]MYT10784.1 hypothetical protein [Streptomyces sp. SID5470]